MTRAFLVVLGAVGLLGCATMGAAEKRDIMWISVQGLEGAYKQAFEVAKRAGVVVDDHDLAEWQAGAQLLYNLVEVPVSEGRAPSVRDALNYIEGLTARLERRAPDIDWSLLKHVLRELNELGSAK